MADRYTDRENAIVTILTANLSSATYLISNHDSINLGAGTKLYNILVNWMGFDNDLDAGDTHFKTDRERFRLICTPLSGATDDMTSVQCNKMTAEVVDALRNPAIVNAFTIDPGECLTQFRIESVDKGIYQEMLSAQITFSFLVDE